MVRHFNALTHLLIHALKPFVPRRNYGDSFDIPNNNEEKLYANKYYDLQHSNHTKENVYVR